MKYETRGDQIEIARYHWLVSTCDMSSVGLLAFEIMCESWCLEWVFKATENLKGTIVGAFLAFAENVYTLESSHMSQETADYVASFREAEAQLDAMSELQAARFIEALRKAVLDECRHWPEHHRRMQATSRSTASPPSSE